MEELKDKVAIVTGGSRGIGRATCVALASKGVSIAVVGRNHNRIIETVEKLKEIYDTSGFSTSSAIGFILDVRVEVDMEIMARQTLDKFGRIDILIASAGIGKSSFSDRFFPYSISQLPTAEWDEILDTNLKGIFLSNRAVLPAMIDRRRGVIINISSLAVEMQPAPPFAAAYCASKYGVVGFSESLTEEVGSYGIKVYCVVPGSTDTPMISKSNVELRYGKSFPAERVANFIIYLLGLPENIIIKHPVIIPFQSYKGGKEKRL